ncbi:arabinose-5-phosphate isomerase [Vibrio lentus]|uniref:KpsF/GutQ family sugar-phosphate isomerase n=1 Tax=Vibrio lentus TaxID=136468 RepID=UPI000C82304A|nr:KpsF/GutQ family sugar-phosphate isomerase [Vibrio lentus]PMH28227.1 arabinose-5-phosphate isomerase [Vibrio lentus]PMK70208.1 arabinose-5-phosphate isomerase [Vibrio lentus]
MSNSVSIAKEVIQTEIEGLHYMSSNLGAEFEAAVQGILKTKGRTIICGMGKSGIIGKKIAASFASTGTPSFFMHPGEAFHGDLGMVTPYDVFIAISNSGETEEVLKLLPFLKDNNNFIIAITGNKASTLSINSNCHLNISVPKEACKLQLAPTSSTTATLVMGDALTVALMELRDFQPENFARFHPGGSLGKRLLSKVANEMVSDNLPLVTKATSMMDLINTMTTGSLGLAIAVTSDNRLQGIVTDGDLRRAMYQFGNNLFSLTVADILTVTPQTISQLSSMQSAIDTMTEKQVNTLIVVDNSSVVGVIKK